MSQNDTLPPPINTTYPPMPTQSTTIPVPNTPSDTPSAAAPAAESLSTPPIPMVHLRVLLISGQSKVFSFEPDMPVGRAKELIWSMWPSDWTSPAQPPSPSFLRILHGGRILGDDSTLSSNNLPASLTPNQPTVIHLSVRSFSIRNEDADTKKPSLLHPTTSRTRNGAENEVSGCKCVIM